MQYLYASKRDGPFKLVATFDSEPQLRAYVRWATLEEHGPGRGKFEQGSALAGFEEWEQRPLADSVDDVENVVHNPSPSML